MITSLRLLRIEHLFVLPTVTFPIVRLADFFKKSNSYRDFHLDADPTALHPAARALTALQASFGNIPSVYGKGRAARQVCDLAAKMRKELAGSGASSKMQSQIDTLVIIDRQVGGTLLGQESDLEY